MIDHTIAHSVGSEALIVRVTSNGSISLPAAIRKRWGVGRVAVIDRGELAVVRAVPDDPIEYFRGRFAGPGPNTDELRARDRRAEASEERAQGPTGFNVTVLLDAYALIAYLRDEPAAPVVQRLLWLGELAISTVQLAEVLDRMERVHGVACDEIEVAVSALGIEVVVADYPVGAEAGRLRARHYLPTGRTLSLADSFCAATAVLAGHSLATADPVLIAVAEAEGCSVVRLPTAA